MNDLVKAEQFTPVQIFIDGQADPILDAIIKEAKSFVPDISTPKGRKEIASMASKVARSKTYLDDLGKDLVSEWKEKAKKVDEVRRSIRERLDSLKEEVRAPLTAWEKKEEDRIKHHEDRLKALVRLGLETSKPLEEMRQVVADLEAMDVSEGAWDEFYMRAQREREVSLSLARQRLAELEEQAAKDAELKRLRDEEEKRLRAEHERKIAEGAARKAREEAERKAEAARLAAERERAEAERKAREERVRVEREKQAAMEQKRLAEERARKAEEDAKRAQEKAENDARAAKLKAEQDRKAAEDRAREEERQRIQREKEAQEREQAKREADLKHRKKINNEALAALMTTGMDESFGKTIIEMIAKGQVPHVRIHY
jgi:hypothetical protein